MKPVTDIREYRARRESREVVTRLERELKASLEHCQACNRPAFVHSANELIACAQFTPA